MPTYEYRCKSCGHELEVVQSFSDDALTKCPSCGGVLRKVFGSIGVTFKGSGFYKTDSRSGSGSKTAASSGSGSSDGGKDSSSSSKESSGSTDSVGSSSKESSGSKDSSGSSSGSSGGSTSSSTTSSGT